MVSIGQPSLDDEQLRAQVFALLAAGHETTSVSMSWTLNELEKYPGIQEKIRTEANEVLGDGRYTIVSMLQHKLLLAEPVMANKSLPELVFKGRSNLVAEYFEYF